ncbi:MAG: MBL fold metallo-hydrolase [Candidatus Moraniibacteriota bacterium]|nr:MAG: MBL fold metallo-hydrolase [Candidatus Moranbacteria bacterium]
MIIQYFGGTSFKIQTRPEGRLAEELTFFIDPDEKTAGLKGLYTEADIIFLTSSKKKSSLSKIKGKPMSIHLPGEYSHHRVNIIGYDCENRDGVCMGDKIGYFIEVEDIKIVHLGTCGNVPKEVYAQVNNCDILMIPIGGLEAMDVKRATDFIRSIEPKIIIPMYYGIPQSYGEENTKDAFYSEMAIKDCEVLPKLTIKSRDLVNRNMDIVELLPQIL